MPTRSYALEPGGPKRLEVRWKGIWKELTVSLDGQVVGTVPDKAALKAGADFTLADGSTLRVALVTSGINNVELELRRNGQPLPGSSADPEVRLKNAAYVLYFVAALSVGFGVVALACDVKLLQDLGMGLPSIVEGAIFGVLGFFTLRRSMAALIIAIGLFGVDTLLTLGASVVAGQAPVAGILIRFGLMMALVRGVPALRELKRAAAPATQPSQLSS